MRKNKVVAALTAMLAVLQLLAPAHALALEAADGWQGADSVTEVSQRPETQVSIAFSEEEPGAFVVSASGSGNWIAVQASVWTMPDRSDEQVLACHPGERGIWTASATNAAFNFRTGTYMTEVAASENGSDWTVLGSASSTVHYRRGTLEFPAAGTSSFYSFRLRGAQVPQECPVWFRVWSAAAGPDRSLVYPGRRGEDGTYTAMVALSAHRDSGLYHVAAMCGSMDEPIYLNSGSFVVPGIDSASLLVSEMDGSAGTMQVRLEAESKCAVPSARLAAWSVPDQSDLFWYEMEPAEDGFAVTVDVANHGHHFGRYTLHAYAELANGVQTLAADIQANLSASNYVYTAVAGNGMHEVRVLGASEAPVSVAVWSEQNGQDDLVWYPGRRESDGVACVVVVPYRHSGTGTYLAHAYAGENMIGAVTFEMRPEDMLSFPQARIATHCQAVYDEVGRDLESVYLWTVQRITYKPLDWRRKIPAGYTREEAYAVEGFEKRVGDCYVFSAVFAALARGLGYDASYVEGYVWSRRGLWADHGFVVIHTNEGDFVCDPELQSVSKTNKNLFMQPAGRTKATYKWN